MNYFPRCIEFCVAAGLVFSLQSLPAGAAEHEMEAEEEAAPRYVLGVFLGYTHTYGENEPTIGIEGGFNISEKWTAGMVVEQADRDKDTTLVLFGLGYHPTENLRLQLGLGKKDPSETRENVLRLGLAYEFELANEWFIKPYAAYDYIEHEENEPVVGFYFGKAF